ncbi:MAG: hypothetical protein ACFFAZ_16710 [Promethearchaeota archaeon]
MLRLLLGLKNIGFYLIHGSEDSGYIGSLLVTDHKGIPIEFRCSNPIIPTKVQITLYGEAFLPYLGVELCGKSLIRSIENKPKLIFVDEPYLLDLADYAYCPIVFAEMMEANNNSAIATVDESGYIVEEITLDHEGAQSLKVYGKKEIKPNIKELIMTLSATFDIFEPFTRMKKAIDMIIKQKSGLSLT